MFDEVRRRSWRSTLFGPIEELGDAEYLAGGLGWALAVMGIVQCAVETVRIVARLLPRWATVPSGAAWIAALVITAAPVALGLLIWKLRSRVAACVVLVLMLANLAGMAVVAARGRAAAGNPLLALVFTWVALRAVQATFAYHRLAEGAGTAAQELAR